MARFFLSTYNVLVTKSPELNEFLTDEKFGLSDCGQNTITNVFRDVCCATPVVGQVLLEVADLLLELEHLILDQLQTEE